MEALNIGIGYVLDFVSQLWGCKTNLEQKTWLMDYERGTRRAEGKEERVERVKRRDQLTIAADLEI